MGNITIEDSCDCPMPCNSIFYSFSIESSEFDPTELCPNIISKLEDKHFLMKPFYEHQSPPKFVRNLMKIKTNVSAKPMDYCKKNLKYRAEVTFKLASNSMSVIVMSSRLSFFDKMSSFGKKWKYEMKVLYFVSSHR